MWIIWLRVIISLFSLEFSLFFLPRPLFNSLPKLCLSILWIKSLIVSCYLFGMIFYLISLIFAPIVCIFIEGLPSISLLILSLKFVFVHILVFRLDVWPVLIWNLTTIRNVLMIILIKLVDIIFIGINLPTLIKVLVIIVIEILI